MKKMEIKIIDPAGFHARPVSAAVNEAKKYESVVAIVENSRKIVLDSVIDVLKYAIQPGAEVILQAEGPDEDQAIAGVLNALKIANFIEY